MIPFDEDNGNLIFHSDRQALYVLLIHWFVNMMWDKVLSKHKGERSTDLSILKRGHLYLVENPFDILQM